MISTGHTEEGQCRHQATDTKPNADPLPSANTDWATNCGCGACSTPCCGYALPPYSYPPFALETYPGAFPVYAYGVPFPPEAAYSGGWPSPYGGDYVAMPTPCDCCDQSGTTGEGGCTCGCPDCAVQAVPPYTGYFPPEVYGGGYACGEAGGSDMSAMQGYTEEEASVGVRLTAEQLRSADPVRYKTRLCAAHSRQPGSCEYGDHCLFAHGADELRLPASNFAALLRANRLPLHVRDFYAAQLLEESDEERGDGVGRAAEEVGAVKTVKAVKKGTRKQSTQCSQPAAAS